jgi:hypothetical protein
MNEDTSAPTSVSTLIPHVDPKDLFRGVVAGINLRSAPGGASVRVEKSQSVNKIINMVGPKAILGGDQFQLRWIHLPVNSMAWIEVSVNRWSRQPAHPYRNLWRELTKSDARNSSQRTKMPTTVPNPAVYCATMFGSMLFTGDTLLVYILASCGRFAHVTPQV